MGEEDSTGGRENFRYRKKEEETEKFRENCQHNDRSEERSGFRDGAGGPNHQMDVDGGAREEMKNPNGNKEISIKSVAQLFPPIL